ncbi:MAG: HAD family hydrolase [Planctomycetota bacterium]|jgi:HAD superfamily hydrolase (TIGR01509 family)
MSPVIRALIFDFDGLIVDTETPDFEAWRDTFAANGAELTLDDWADCIGREYGYIDFHAVLEEKLGRKLDRAGIKAYRKGRYAELTAGLGPRPGVVPYMEGARERGLALAVASSAPQRWVVPRLERLGLLAGFDCVKTEEDAPEPKPAPDLFLAAAAALGVEPPSCVAFEDSPNGVAAARAAGMFCVAVPNPVTRRLKIEGADLTVDSLADLPLEELLRTAEAR